MKKQIPVSVWGSFVAFLILFVPYFLIPLVRYEWLGRLVSTLLFFGTSLLLIILPILKMQISQNLVSKIGRRNSEYVAGGLKILITLLIITTFFLWIGLSFIKDILYLVENRNKQFPVMVAKITWSRGYPVQEIGFGEDLPRNTGDFLNGFFFPPRYLTRGNVYEFKFLPNSRFILEAKLLEQK